MLDKKFWKGRKVFLTGQTGFKGSWLSIYLNYLGAEVTGYALKPPTSPSLFQLCRVDQLVDSNIGDIRDGDKLKKVLYRAKPEIIIHLAAQPLVRESYINPVETYSINVQGVVNLLDAVRSCESARSLINVTTDKCYENVEQNKDFTESDPLGGYDPYSSSKACSEIVTAAYRRSFLSPKVAVATARAGNVIGGGDWAVDRLIPDFVRAILKDEKILVRYPQAIRPWQHVLEPLTGYLLLVQKLCLMGEKYAGAWNFGPKKKDAKSVDWIVKRLCQKWGQGASYTIDRGKHPHETHYLRLNIAKAQNKLGWIPQWDLDLALQKVVDWTLAYKNKQDLLKVCISQIEDYLL